MRWVGGVKCGPSLGRPSGNKTWMYLAEDEKEDEEAVSLSFTGQHTHSAKQQTAKIHQIL